MGFLRGGWGRRSRGPSADEIRGRLHLFPHAPQGVRPRRRAFAAVRPGTLASSPSVRMSSRPRAGAAGAALLLLLIAAAASAAPSAGRPEVSLNHLSVVLDAATVRDLAANAFLKDTFATVFQKANVSNDGKRWTGTYLYGQRTYLEVYEAGPAQGEPGSSGIALAVEHPGDVTKLVLPLADAGAEATVVLRTAQGPSGAQVPW